MTTFAPVFAVVGWMLPPFLYVLPFLILRELWKASDPGTPVADEGWRRRPVTPLLHRLVHRLRHRPSRPAGGHRLCDGQVTARWRRQRSQQHSRHRRSARRFGLVHRRRRCGDRRRRGDLDHVRQTTDRPTRPIDGRNLIGSEAAWGSPTSSISFVMPRPANVASGTGDDRDRPLSKRGWRQSEAVAKRLAKHGATALYSSGYIRCVQTLEPLGKLIGADVQAEPTLARVRTVRAGARIARRGRERCGAVQPRRHHPGHDPGASATRHGDRQHLPTGASRASGCFTARDTKITKGKVWPAPC